MPGMFRWVSFGGVLAVLLSTANAGQVNEDTLKAAYIFNLAKFVEWPPRLFQNATDPITICVLGENAIQRALAEAVNGEKIDGRKLMVYQYATVQQLGNCHLLFIASSERKHLHSI